MKRLIALMFAMGIVLLFAACGEETPGAFGGNEDGISNDNQQKTDVPASVHAGTRSDPYEFGEDITIISQSWSGDYTVQYTVNFKELWDSEKVSRQYPNYKIEDRLLVRGAITVMCDATDDEIRFDLTPVYITDNLNEEAADIQTYKANELNNQLYSVYSGGTYDVIVLGANDGIGSMIVPYLKINYCNLSGENASLWVALPDRTENLPNQENKNMVDTSETETLGKENSKEEVPKGENEANEPISSHEISEITSLELDAALLEQPMYVEKADYIVQDEKYKVLYPDMLQAIIKNNSGTDVKNAVIAFAAWDANGFPVKIKTAHSLRDGNYVVECNYGDVNMVDGSTYGSESGLPLDSDTDNIATFKAIVVNYDDFDGNTWENPHYDTWIEMYSDKKLSE